MAYSYMQVISLGFPTVQCHQMGLDDVYENIVWDSGSSLPDKNTLDQWILANPVVSNDSNKKITILAFRKRFTLTEKINLELSSIDNPSDDIESRTISASLRVTMKDMETALFIDLDDPITQEGVNKMEQYNLIAPGRASEILTNPVQDNERINF